MDAYSHISNDIRLYQEKVGVKHNQVMKPFDINNSSAFLFVQPWFLDHKDRKTEKGMGLSINQTALPLKLVKHVIDEGFYPIAKGINAWFNSMKPTLLVCL